MIHVDRLARRPQRAWARQGGSAAGLPPVVGDLAEARPWPAGALGRSPTVPATGALPRGEVPRRPGWSLYPRAAPGGTLRWGRGGDTGCGAAGVGGVWSVVAGDAGCVATILGGAEPHHGAKPPWLAQSGFARRLRRAKASPPRDHRPRGVARCGAAVVVTRVRRGPRPAAEWRQPTDGNRSHPGESDGWTKPGSCHTMIGVPSDEPGGSWGGWDVWSI